MPQHLLARLGGYKDYLIESGRRVCARAPNDELFLIQSDYHFFSARRAIHLTIFVVIVKLDARREGKS